MNLHVSCKHHHFGFKLRVVNTLQIFCPAPYAYQRPYSLRISIAPIVPPYSQSDVFVCNISSQKIGISVFHSLPHQLVSVKNFGPALFGGSFGTVSVAGGQPFTRANPAVHLVQYNTYWYGRAYVGLTRKVGQPIVVFNDRDGCQLLSSSLSPPFIYFSSPLTKKNRINYPYLHALVYITSKVSTSNTFPFE